MKLAINDGKVASHSVMASSQNDEVFLVKLDVLKDIRFGIFYFLGSFFCCCCFYVANTAENVSAHFYLGVFLLYIVLYVYKFLMLYRLYMHGWALFNVLFLCLKSIKIYN